MSKLKIAFWELKRLSFGNDDDDWSISNDLQLDSKIQSLQYSDVCLNNLTVVLQQYSNSLKDLKKFEKTFGNTLKDLGDKDPTRAGVAMTVCGNTYRRISRRRKHLLNSVEDMLRDVRSFHQIATADALETAASMERLRNSYRYGLIWLKEECCQLDPEDRNHARKFREVQEHVRKLHNRFHNSKLKTLQKIDLYLFSRCNLFSRSIVPYQREFRKMSSFITANADMALKAIPSEAMNVPSCLNKYAKETFYPLFNSNLPLKALTEQTSGRNLPARKRTKKSKNQLTDGNEAKVSKEFLINFSEDAFQRITPGVTNCGQNKEYYLEDLMLVPVEFKPGFAAKIPSRKEDDEKILYEDVFSIFGEKSQEAKHTPLKKMNKHLDSRSSMKNIEIERNQPEAPSMNNLSNFDPPLPSSKLDEVLNEFDPLKI